jgi:signal transduction histidine kinase
VILVLKLASIPPKVQADRHRIVQVLGNLLTNALRYTPQGGEILLSAELQADMVKVVVADNGVGNPSEDLPYVFDRFWRGEKSRSRSGAGSGLGLAIAKQLEELHGGTIRVSSKPTEGSSFWFTLPIASGSSKADQPYTALVSDRG